MASSRFIYRITLSVFFWFATSFSCYAVPPLPQPSWAELSSEQREILAPLASEWSKLEGFRRKKWLGIAQRYKSLSPDEQTRIQQRMTHWAKLSPEERNLARSKYLALKKANPETKGAVKQKWQEYEGLPETEKDRLKAAATNKGNSLVKPDKGGFPNSASKPVAAPTLPQSGVQSSTPHQRAP